MNTQRFSLLLGLALLWCCPSVLWAREQAITLTDYTGRGFAPDLVQYAVPAKQADKLRLFTKDGQPVTCQVARTDAQMVMLSFVTDLPPGGKPGSTSAKLADATFSDRLSELLPDPADGGVP